MINIGICSFPTQSTNILWNETFLPPLNVWHNYRRLGVGMQDELNAATLNALQVCMQVCMQVRMRAKDSHRRGGESQKEDGTSELG